MNWKRIKKATLIGVASLALIIPLGMNTNTSVHAAGLMGNYTKREWYYDILVNPSDDMATNADELQDIWEHPFLKHTHAAKDVFEDYQYWDGPAYDAYAHHFKQLYSPYLYPAMPKRITYNEAVHYKRDEYLLHKGQEQLGLLGNHKRIHRARHAKRHARKPRYRKPAKRRNRKHNKRARKPNKRNRRNRKARKHIRRY